MWKTKVWFINQSKISARHVHLSMSMCVVHLMNVKGDSTLEVCYCLCVDLYQNNGISYVAKLKQRKIIYLVHCDSGCDAVEAWQC